MKRYLLKIEAEGDEENLIRLAQILKYIESLGNIGHTTSFKVWVDGDGAARLRFKFPDIKTEVKLLEGMGEEPKEGFKFYLE